MGVCKCERTDLDQHCVCLCVCLLARATVCVKMDKLPMYHGSISKSRAEEILAEAGEDGSYLIRDSESLPDTYCICVLGVHYVFTYRVTHEGGLWKTETTPGVKERVFRNVKNLLAAYKNPDQGLAVPLLFPVNNSRHHGCNKNNLQPHQHHQHHQQRPPLPPRKCINC